MATAFRASFVRDLKKLKDQRVREQVRAVIEAVESAEALADLPNVKKMSGSGGYYRVRIGDYRIGRAAEGAEVEFVRVLHRKDVYRRYSMASTVSTDTSPNGASCSSTTARSPTTTIARSSLRRRSRAVRWTSSGVTA